MSGYGVFFDGRKHHLQPSQDFDVPWQVEGEFVERDVQPKDLDPLETPELNLTSSAMEPRELKFWESEKGWTDCVLRLRAIAVLIGGDTKHALEYRSDPLDPFGPPLSKDYVFQFVSGSQGWEGVDPL